MADTSLKIKRSQTTATPPTLKEGELAFSYSSNQLFIGGVGGATVIPITSPQAVASVNGKTGVVVLNNVDVGAAATVHTHTASQITDFTAAVNALIPTPPVTSVNTKTGAVVLTNVDVGAAATVHTHTASQITDFTAAVNALIPTPPVTSVNTKTGAVVLNNVDVGAAATVHTHTASAITDFVTAVEALIPVDSVNGKTGDVVLNNVDVGAAATVHTHTTAAITDFASAVETVVNNTIAATSLDQLADVSVPNPTNSQLLTYSTADAQWIAADPVPALSFFTQLTDVPHDYSGQAGFAVIVKSSEDGLEFSNQIDGGTF